jgi:hypothetical protein
LQYASKAIFPSVKITSIVSSSGFTSSKRYYEQFDFSDGFGLLCGGAHFTAAVIYEPLSTSLSSLDRLIGFFANPVSNMALTIQSPELSPVNILPFCFHLERQVPIQLKSN